MSRNSGQRERVSTWATLRGIEVVGEKEEEGKDARTHVRSHRSPSIVWRQRQERVNCSCARGGAATSNAIMRQVDRAKAGPKTAPMQSAKNGPTNRAQETSVAASKRVTLVTGWKGLRRMGRYKPSKDPCMP